MANFLDSSIIPGTQMPKHEHRKMFGVLVVVIVVAVGVGLYMWGNKPKQQEIQPTVTTSKISDVQATQIANELKKAAVTVSPEEKDGAAKMLSKSAVKITDQQKADALKMLNAAAR